MKTRIIHTKFWEDSFVCNLDPLEKLIFLYLLTNQRVGLTGIYELPDKFIIFDLDIELEKLQSTKKKLQDEGRIYFVDSYIAIRNASKYNDYSKGNDNQRKAFAKEITDLPEKVKNYLRTRGFEYIDNYISTSCQLVTQQDINHKSKTINNKSEIRTHKQETINEKEDMSKELEKAKKALADKLHWNS